MFRLRSGIASHILSSPSTSAISTLRRLISAAAPAISPHPEVAVAAEDYLVDTCGLTRAQAMTASTKLSHRLKSRDKADAVLAFLADLGLSSTAVTAIVARDPKFLCAQVDKTLAPNVAELTGLGLSPCEIARLVSLAPNHFRRRTIVSYLQYYLSLFGASGPGKLLRTLERSPYLVGANLERVVKPNVEFLRQCGLSACDIAKVCIPVPRLLTTKQERIRAMVTRADGLGVPRGSGMFKNALMAIAYLSEEKIADKVDYLKKTCRWSDAEVSTALTRAPVLLTRSKDMLRHKSEFLISQVGLKPAYIAHRPVLLYYSMEGRLKPRYHVLKFIKENWFLDRDWSFCAAIAVSDDVFVKKFIFPHKQVAPHLAEDYATPQRGSAK